MALLNINNPSLRSGEVLSFDFTGFRPYGQVWVGVIGGGGLYFYANALGNGSGSFQVNEGPGFYTLEAYDNIENYAAAGFTITEVGSETWTLLSTATALAVHTANLLGWALLSTANVVAAHSSNLQGWALLSTINVQVLHSGNLLGWALLSTVNAQVAHKSDGGGGEEPPPESGGTNMLIPLAIVGGALLLSSSGEKDKKKAGKG